MYLMAGIVVESRPGFKVFHFSGSLGDVGSQKQNDADRRGFGRRYPGQDQKLQLLPHDSGSFHDSILCGTGRVPTPRETIVAAKFLVVDL